MTLTKNQLETRGNAEEGTKGNDNLKKNQHLNGFWRSWSCRSKLRKKSQRNRGNKRITLSNSREVRISEEYVSMSNREMT